MKTKNDIKNVSKRYFRKMKRIVGNKSEFTCQKIFEETNVAKVNREKYAEL